ncbi:unnamed protein product [Soboliphyme baturini]|uniref:Tetratricopeptide repeat protein 30 n=1 Tax=Soboliphyme baturini TaxID=241478 RepID=A0A183IJR4_9BILA|nr:unnamed protein product [Soboliphyme baturini]
MAVHIYSPHRMINVLEVSLESCSDDDPDKQINQACIDFKSEDYQVALDRFLSVVRQLGYTADLRYNIALCYFKLKNYTQALRYTADVIENAIKDHPELSVGMVTDGLEVYSVGNTLVLSETALIEAFNLKAAIEYTLKNCTYSSCCCKTFFQPRPSGTFCCCTVICLNEHSVFQYYDMAADLLAENASFTYKYLDQNTFDFLDAIITGQTSPEESFKKFEVMSVYHTEVLRKLTNEVHEMRKNQNEEGASKAVEAFDEQLEQYLPVLMAQAKIFWDAGDYVKVEKVFRKSVEFCSEHSVWRLNVAHTLFMQETKFKEAAGFYEPVIKRSFDNILEVSAIVLANLCVCYIMTNQNEEAEELMRKVEKEEERLLTENAGSKVFHLCIINLVIGTLYCSKGNYEFGISRIIKAMDISSNKLGPDTWFYVKRCFLALAENMAKHVISVSDNTIDECIQFLEQCEGDKQIYKVSTVVDGPLYEILPENRGKNSVTYEARYLNYLLKNIMSC